MPDPCFTETELVALGDLRSSLPSVQAWPPENPLSFVLMLAPRTRGKLGEELLERLSRSAGLAVGPATSVAFDKTVSGRRHEVKFSTEDPPRFQQVRDPREAGGSLKYDYLTCISARPEGLVYWLLPALDVGSLMDAGVITVQHAMSDTKWFRPVRMGRDEFAKYRLHADDFVAALRDLD